MRPSLRIMFVLRWLRRCMSLRVRGVRIGLRVVVRGRVRRIDVP